MIRIELESLLSERGRSFYWLAKETGINQAIIYKMRHQKVKAVSLDSLERICIALDCEPGDVLLREKVKAASKRRTTKGRAKR